MDEVDADDERAEELSTLQSIYPELDHDASDPYTASLSVPIIPTKPLATTFDQETTVHNLDCLPSLDLTIILPPEYPANAPPIVQVSTSPLWLPQEIMNNLTSEARSIWEEYGGGTILFSYITSLQDQAEAAFGLDQPVQLPLSLKEVLLRYSNRMKKDLFDKETFDCEVCLEPKKGSVCYRLERCGHVFCVACLQDYYNSSITEGNVNMVKCMSTECSSKDKRKKERLISPKELLRIPISRDQVERYAKIKRKKKIESDTSIVFCPRTWCQGAMKTTKYPRPGDVGEIDDSDSELEDEDPVPQKDAPVAAGPEKRAVGVQGMDRLAICEDCNLAFCVLCLASWHGDFVRCEPREAKELTEEDQASLNYILQNTSPCPTCSVPCIKAHGCNHMTCGQCKSHFCYLCGAWLDPAHPYYHFNNPKNKHCFQRLFEGVEGDMANGEMHFAGRRGAEQLADFWEQEAMRIQREILEEDAR